MQQGTEIWHKPQLNYYPDIDILVVTYNDFLSYYVYEVNEFLTVSSSVYINQIKICNFSKILDCILLLGIKLEDKIDVCLLLMTVAALTVLPDSRKDIFSITKQIIEEKKIIG